jgi:hypothetical protein
LCGERPHATTAAQGGFEHHSHSLPAPNQTSYHRLGLVHPNPNKLLALHLSRPVERIAHCLLEDFFFSPRGPSHHQRPSRRCGAEEMDTATIQNRNCRRRSRLPCSLVPGTSCRWGAVPAQSETLTNAELCVDLLLHPSSNGSAEDGAHLIRAHRAAPSLAPYQGPSSPDLTVTWREISGAGSYLVMLPRCPTYF